MPGKLSQFRKPSEHDLCSLYFNVFVKSFIGFFKYLRYLAHLGHTVDLESTGICDPLNPAKAQNNSNIDKN